MSWEAWGDGSEFWPDPCKSCEGEGTNPSAVIVGNVEFVVMDQCDSCKGKGYIEDDFYHGDEQ